MGDWVYGLGILAALVTVLYLIKDIFIWVFSRLKKFFSPYKKYSSIRDFVERSGILKKEKRVDELNIAVVDDQPENYPCEDIVRAKLSVLWLDEISLNDVEFLLDFDIVFLDITGVVKEDLKRGGFELLKRIKGNEVSPFVVGVSSKRFDPTLTEFWSLSDGQIKTPVDFVKFEEQVLKAWRNSYSCKNIAFKIDALIGESKASASDKERVNRLIMKFLDGRIDKSDLLKKVSSCNHLIDSHSLVEHCSKLRGLFV